METTLIYGCDADAAAGWDADLPGPVEIASSWNSGRIDNNTKEPDITAMDEDGEDQRTDGDEQTSDKVAFIGKDGAEAWCSRTRVSQQSDELSRLLSNQQDSAGRIHLPVRSNEAHLLAKGIDAYDSSWDSYGLEDLMRAVDLFYNYNLRQWDRIGLETAILNCLDRSEEEGGPCALLRDQRFADKLLYTAQQGCMSELVKFIDAQGFSSTAHYIPEDDRPRKRRKVSTGLVDCGIACT